MPHAFRFRPDAAGTEADDSPVYLPLICRRRPARADKVSAGHPSQAIDIYWSGNPTARQGNCHSQSEHRPRNVPPHCSALRLHGSWLSLARVVRDGYTNISSVYQPPPGDPHTPWARSTRKALTPEETAAIIASAANWLRLGQRARITGSSPSIDGSNERRVGRVGIVWRLCSPTFADDVYINLDLVGQPPRIRPRTRPTP